LVVADKNPEYVLLDEHFLHLATTLSPSTLITLKNVPSTIVGTLEHALEQLVFSAILFTNKETT
jgi:hypothetical protein